MKYLKEGIYFKFTNIEPNKYYTYTVYLKNTNTDFSEVYTGKVISITTEIILNLTDVVISTMKQNCLTPDYTKNKVENKTYRPNILTGSIKVILKDNNITIATTEDAIDLFDLPIKSNTNYQYLIPRIPYNIEFPFVLTGQGQGNITLNNNITINTYNNTIKPYTFQTNLKLTEDLYNGKTKLASVDMCPEEYYIIFNINECSYSVPVKVKTTYNIDTKYNSIYRHSQYSERSISYSITTNLLDYEEYKAFTQILKSKYIILYSLKENSFNYVKIAQSSFNSNKPNILTFTCNKTWY